MRHPMGEAEPGQAYLTGDDSTRVPPALTLRPEVLETNEENAAGRPHAEEPAPAVAQLRS
jgi:hypothetical protein